MHVHCPSATPPPALPQLQADLPACLEAWPDYALWALSRAVAAELAHRRLPVPVGLPVLDLADAALRSLTPGSSLATSH
jgi:hypothetical protein